MASRFISFWLLRNSNLWGSFFLFFFCVDEIESFVASQCSFVFWYLLPLYIFGLLKQQLLLLCFFSPLIRSRRTAEIIWHTRNEEMITDSDLREIDLYSFQVSLVSYCCVCFMEMLIFLVLSHFSIFVYICFYFLICFSLN